MLTGAGEHFSSGNDLGNFLTAVSKGNSHTCLTTTKKMSRNHLCDQFSHLTTSSTGLDPAEMAERGRAMLDNLVAGHC